MKKIRNYETPTIVEHMMSDAKMEAWMGHPSRFFLEQIVDFALTEYKAEVRKARDRQVQELGL